MLIIKVLSPVRKGNDNGNYDTILGSTGVVRLGLGIDRESGRLYIKKRNCLHK